MVIDVQNLLAAFFYPLPSGERVKMRGIRKEKGLSATLSPCGQWREVKMLSPSLAERGAFPSRARQQAGGSAPLRSRLCFPNRNAIALTGRGKRHAPRAGNLSLLLLIFLTVPYSLFIQTTLAAAATTPEQYEQQAWTAFQRGAFEEAVLSWQNTVRLYERQEKRGSQVEALVHLSQAYQAVGQYQEALKALEAALVLVDKSGDPSLYPSVLANLGNVYSAIGQVDKAAQYLNAAVDNAKTQSGTQLTATTLNDLGNLLWTQEKFSEAVAAYQESKTFADKAGSPALSARALTNAAMALRHTTQTQESRAFLDQALEQTRSLNDSHDKAYGLIAVGLGYRDLRPQLPHDSVALLQLAGKTFTEAAAVAESTHDARAASYAWGYLGELYEEERRYQEALQLSQRAIAAIQNVQAPEALYLWQWQTGRLLKAQHASGDAITAYRLALATLETVRQEMTQGGKVRRASARETVKGVYLGLVDLLLQRAAFEANAAQVEADLREARDLMEAFKVAELQDYFRDDCVELLRASTKPLDEVSRTAAVVYPIVLPDRLELLVSVPTDTKVELQRFTVPVAAKTLAQEVNEFRRHGKRASRAGKTKELRQIGNLPPGPLPFDFHRAFAGIPPEQGECQAVEERHILRGRAIIDPAGIFAKHHIEHPVQSVLNAPVSPNGAANAPGMGRQTTKKIAHLHTLLPGRFTPYDAGHHDDREDAQPRRALRRRQLAARGQHLHRALFLAPVALVFRRIEPRGPRRGRGGSGEGRFNLGVQGGLIVFDR
jgi:tetratricopeptide (TPR) repeat protein